MMPHRRIGAARKAVLAIMASAPFVICGTAYAADATRISAHSPRSARALSINSINLPRVARNSLIHRLVPKAARAGRVERELVAYLTKNKEWCGVPTKLSKIFRRAPENPPRSPSKPARWRRK